VVFGYAPVSAHARSYSALKESDSLVHCAPQPHSDYHRPAACRTILTGQARYTHVLVGYQDGLEFNPSFTLPALLSNVGYQTQLVGKLHMFPQRKRFGFDHMALSEHAVGMIPNPLS